MNSDLKALPSKTKNIQPSSIIVMLLSVIYGEALWIISTSFDDLVVPPVR
jgi:hypothetical protein